MGHLGSEDSKKRQAREMNICYSKGGANKGYFVPSDWGIGVNCVNSMLWHSNP